MKKAGTFSLLLLGGLCLSVWANDCCSNSVCSSCEQCTSNKSCQCVGKFQTKEEVHWSCKYVDVCLPSCRGCEQAGQSCECANGCCEKPCGRLVRKKHLLKIIEKKKVYVRKCEPVSESCSEHAPSPSPTPAPLKMKQAPPPPSVTSTDKKPGVVIRLLGFFKMSR